MEYTIQVGAEQALRLIEGGINALDRAEDATITLTWPQIQQRRQTLQAEFRRLDEAQPDLVAGLALARPDGRIVVTDSAVNPDAIATPQRLAAAEGLRTARRGTLSFDPPPAEGFGAHAGLLLSRPRKIEGRPADGVLSAALREEPFLRAWTTAARDLPDARFALVRDDGTVLMPARIAGAATLVLPDGASRPGGELDIGDPFATGASWFLRHQRLGDLPVSLLLAIPTAPHESDKAMSLGRIAMASFLAGLVLALMAMLIRDRMRSDMELVRRLESKAAELAAEIARRAAAEEGLRNAQRMEAVGRLTGGIAHDFNNLLTAILGTARALERHLGPAADARTRRLLAASIAAVDRGARLNASLLAFARRQPLTLATIDTNALVEDFVPLLRRAVGETVSVQLNLDHRLPPCRADAAQVESALLNLAINARDAMPRGGMLRIVTRHAWLQEQALAGNTDAVPGPYVALEVHDDGLGMPAEVRERAFEPFFTTKPDGQGTGLGLSQIFGFMRQIGGHVAIHSLPGRGTTVTLYLPLGDGMDGGALRFEAPPAPVPMPVVGNGTSVLVVEDETSVRAVVVELLTDAGFEVRAAEDGPSALAMLKDGKAADILFSDVVMPGGMTGVELAREARRVRPRIVVLLASGYAGEALDLQDGTDEFELISKPYDTDQLLRRIAALRRPRLAPA